jgi:hypothetical protein
MSRKYTTVVSFTEKEIPYIGLSVRLRAAASNLRPKTTGPFFVEVINGNLVMSAEEKKEVTK